MKDHEPSFRLRPRKPKASPSRDGRLWASAYLLLCGALRQGRAARRRAARARSGRHRASQVYLQRAAVRITYSKNRRSGQWRAHGRYIVRESAARAREAGFDRTSDSVDIARKLDQWQKGDDERLWKIIISPEFGDRVDLKQLTRTLLDRMEVDLETRLEWVAVTHSNTEYKHVHVALRGRRDDGQPLTLGRDYIKAGIRRHTEALCTQQLGYRTQQDMEEAHRREIPQVRFTSLDRMIARDNPQDGQFPKFLVRPESKRLLDRSLIERLQRLECMGLAERIGPISWNVRTDFEQVLRSMHKTADRQRTLANHGLPVSDKRLPFQVLDWRAMTSVEGRVLVHGEDEASDRHYLMLEGVDARIHFVPYTHELELARSCHQLRPGSFVALYKRFESGRPVVDVNDRGDAEALLNNEQYFADTAKRLLRRGVIGGESWDGWLGRYQNALRAALQQRKHRDIRGEIGR